MGVVLGACGEGSLGVPHGPALQRALQLPASRKAVITFEVPQPNAKIAQTANVTVAQGMRPPLHAAVELTPDSRYCRTASKVGIVCKYGFKLGNANVTYRIELVDKKGRVTYRGSYTVAANYANSFSFIIYNRWTSARVAFQNPVRGAASRIPVAVSAYYEDAKDDLSGTVIGPQRFTTPITLVDTDKTGATKLSRTQITSPGQAVFLRYDGRSFVNPVIGVKLKKVVGQMLLPSIRVQEFELPSHDSTATNAGFGRMIANADGSFSFLENQGVGRITFDGIIQETKLPAYDFDIAKGPDANLWALVNDQTSASSQALARINSDGTLTEYPLTDWSSGPLILGPDGNFWMPASTSTGVVRRVTPTGTVTDFSLGTLQRVGLDDIVVGPDGNFWLDGSAVQIPGTSGDAMIVRMATDGTYNIFWLPGNVKPCCNGVELATLTWASGKLYTVDASPESTSATYLERLAPAGSFREFPANLDIALPSSTPFNMATLGPDGALWYPSAGFFDQPCVLGRVTTNGDVAFVQFAKSCPGPYSSTALPNAMMAGPDNTLWYTRGDVVGKIIL
jgi:streptogramin lyase